MVVWVSVPAQVSVEKGKSYFDGKKPLKTISNEIKFHHLETGFDHLELRLLWLNIPN